MGTHPIFESDFDCLTDKICIVSVVATPGSNGASIAPSRLVSTISSPKSAPGPR